MKPAAFDYARPADVEEACALLAQNEDARLIAGGQTLVPLMAMRLARPSQLIDISRISALSYVRETAPRGALEIGAVTRQCTLEHDPLVRAKIPLLAKAIPYVGHAPIRARGTIGGSLVNADPAAELALVAVTLGARFHYRTGVDSSEMSARQFFRGAMTTALPAAACLTAVAFPVWPDDRLGAGFHEVSARRSDFAFAAAAAQIALDADGTCRRLALGVGAVTAVPLRLDAVERALAGTRITPAAAREAIHAALAGIAPLSDLHASAEYRRRAAATLALRALMDAQRAAAARGADDPRGAHAAPPPRGADAR